MISNTPPTRFPAIMVMGRDGQLSSCSLLLAQALELVSTQATASNRGGQNRLTQNLNVFGIFSLMLPLGTPKAAQLDQAAETL